MGYSTHIFNDTPANLSGVFMVNGIETKFEVAPKSISVVDYPGHYNTIVRIETYENVDIRLLNFYREVTS